MSEERFDVTARRFHQWGVIALTTLAFLVVDPIVGGAVMIVVGLIMIVGRFRDEADVIRGFYHAVLKPRGILREDMVVEDRATRRVARVMGGTIQLLGGVAIAAGLGVEVAWAAWVLIGAITVMIALDAALSFCVLCFVVHAARRVMRTA